MVLKVLLMVSVVVVAYLWLVRIKQGPVYESEKSLQGKTVLITGGNDGIGKATVIELAKKDARIIMASRNLQKSETARKEIVELTGNNKIIVMELDLGNQEFVRSFVREFKDKEDNLDILINNAGVFFVSGTTDDGISRTFNINHLGPFLLTNLLMDMMKVQAKKRPVRIINLSSVQYRFGRVSKERIYLDAQNTVDLWTAYSDSKIATILFTSELDRRFKDDGITFYSLDPGFIKTDIFRTSTSLVKTFIATLAPVFSRTPYYGAQTIMYCALDDDVVKYSGRYFVDCAPAELYDFAKNRTDAEYLWEESLKLTGLA